MKQRKGKSWSMKTEMATVYKQINEHRRIYGPNDIELCTWEGEAPQPVDIFKGVSQQQVINKKKRKWGVG
jgi:hypothetical protein